MRTARVVIYVDEDTNIDLASVRVEPGAVLEVRHSRQDGIRRFTDPVVTVKHADGSVSSVDTRIEP